MSGTLKGLRPRRPRGWWLQPLAVAVAYYGAGRLVWLVAGPPGHAAPLWPAAGITLAVLLLSRDLALATGATLGGFALALHACLATTSGLDLWRVSAVAAVVGVAAGLEPLLAALLAGRSQRFPSALNHPGAVLRFALMAGPAPAALGAALATGALFWAGLIPQAQLPREAALWWAGDTVGLVVFGPLAMVLGAGRSEVSWRRRYVVAVPVLAMTALALTLFVRAKHWDERRGEAVVGQRADALTGTVERALLYNLDALRTAADFLGSGRIVEAETFRRVATGIVVRHFAFTALAWAPAAIDGRAVPVELVDPPSADARLNGSDLAAEPSRQAKLSAARHSGEAIVLDGPSDGRAVWVFVPAPGRTGDNGVAGFVGGLLRLDLLVERAVTGVDRHGIGLELRDEGGGKVLHRLSSSPVGGGMVMLPVQTRLTVAERVFAVTPVVSRATLAVERSGEAWIVLMAGLLLSALLQGVLLVLTGDRDAEDTVIEAEWPAAYRTKAEAATPRRR